MADHKNNRCSYGFEKYIVTYLATRTLSHTCHCTTFCIIRAALGYRYNTMCMLLQICHKLRLRKYASKSYWGIVKQIILHLYQEMMTHTTPCYIS